MDDSRAYVAEMQLILYWQESPACSVNADISFSVLTPRTQQRASFAVCRRSTIEQKIQVLFISPTSSVIGSF